MLLRVNLRVWLIPVAGLAAGLAVGIYLFGPGGYCSQPPWNADYQYGEPIARNYRSDQSAFRFFEIAPGGSSPKTLPPGQVTRPNYGRGD